MDLPGKVQMIDERGSFNTETEKFVQDLPARCLYTVMSIIGPQSSGKSYLLNALFGTEFDVLEGSEGREQTTKGIWIAKRSKPCMIIVDVEGTDGWEREDDTLFERRSALFSLAISDFMLLNMSYTDIGRRQAAGTELIKLIFKERVKMHVPITEIIIVVRDHDYDVVKPEITKRRVEENVAQLWQQVNPSITMSDYIKVTVKDLPRPRQLEIELFHEKCQDLAKFLCTAAENGTLEQMSHAPSFATRAKTIWDTILKNKILTAADQKLAVSTHACYSIFNSMVKSLQEEQEYYCLMSVTTMKEFNAKLKIFLSSLLERYEKDTITFDASIRNDMKEKLQSEIVQTFVAAFDEKAGDQVNNMVSEAESEVLIYLKKHNKWDESAVTEVRNLYLKTFDEDSLEDLQPQFEGIRAKHREYFERSLTSIAEKKAYDIKKAVSTSECPAVVKRMLESLPQEKEFDRLIAVTTPLEEFNTILASFLVKLLARYEENTAMYDAIIRNENKAGLESKIVQMFKQTFDTKAAELVIRMRAEAESRVPVYLRNLKKWPDASVVKDVQNLHLKAFDDRSRKDLHQNFEGTLKEHRDDFARPIIMFVKEEANNVKLEISTYECNVVKNRALDSLHEEQEYGYLMSVTTIKEFNATLKSFLSRLLGRYENETGKYDAAIRSRIKAELESEIVKRFENTFKENAADLVNRKLSEAESTIPTYYRENYKWPNKSAVNEVRLLHLKTFDDDSRGDLHPRFERILEERRNGFEERLKKIAKKEASEMKKTVGVALAAMVSTRVAIATLLGTISASPLVAFANLADLPGWITLMLSGKKDRRKTEGTSSNPSMALPDVVDLLASTEGISMEEDITNRLRELPNVADLPAAFIEAVSKDKNITNRLMALSNESDLPAFIEAVSKDRDITNRLMALSNVGVADRPALIEAVSKDENK